MKHWARFTLKMMARLGLAAAVTAWLVSQTSMTYVTVTVARTSVMAGVFGHGWVLFWAPLRSSAPWWEISGHRTGAARMRKAIDNTYPNHNRLLPGVEHRWTRRRDVLLLSHRFVCLMMLVAVIATGVGWRKRETSTETAVETTAVTGQE